jgi:hypothetical protein
MKDLQWTDINYANNFPADICMHSAVVVQIPESGQGTVLYTSKVTGKQSNCGLPFEFRAKYTNDIYVFGA